MYKKFLILLILTLVPVTSNAYDENIESLLRTARAIGATDAQIAEAIKNNKNIEELVYGKIRIKAPERAAVGQPVLVSVEGLPEKCAKVWRISPEGFTWLELYDANGVPVNIFWSSKQNTFTFDLIVAENGPEVPIIELASHTLILGTGPAPPPIPGPEPTPELQDAVAPVIAFINAVSVSDIHKQKLHNFYNDFSKVVAKGGDLVTTSDFREAYIKAGTIMFEDSGITYKGLGGVIDNVLVDTLGLDVKPLDAAYTSEVLEAIAWAFTQ